MTTRGTKKGGPPCGHSACSQNYIDTGERDCIADDLTEEEQERAMAEGWLLAEGCEIQADDDSEAFRVGDASRDDLAIAHVRARAAEGSELHALALRLHDADREECDGSDEGGARCGCDVCDECGFHNDHSLSCRTGRR